MMTLKLIGAFLVFVGCGGFGFAMASYHRREEEAHRQLISVLHWMEWELSCRQTSLPQLCDCGANVITGPVHHFFKALAAELESQLAPDATTCVHTVLEKHADLPQSLSMLLQDLGTTLGRFDLPAQLQGIRSIRAHAEHSLQSLSENRSSRLRSYQTLGLCAGAALAILFL